MSRRNQDPRRDADLPGGGTVSADFGEFVEPEHSDGLSSDVREKLTRTLAAASFAKSLRPPEEGELSHTIPGDPEPEDFRTDATAGRVRASVAGTTAPGGPGRGGTGTLVGAAESSIDSAGTDPGGEGPTGTMAYASGGGADQSARDTDPPGVPEEAAETADLPRKPNRGAPPASPADSRRSLPARGVAGRSKWDLRIHPRAVDGEISGVAGSANRAGHGLASAIVNDPDAPEYEIQSKLGAGNMGVVYLARQTSVSRDVAIKALNEQQSGSDYSQAMFVSEAVITANLVHPNIVPIHDLGRTADGKLFYAMKRVTGTPWNETIRDDRPLEEKLDILMKVADAVAYAHSRGVVNRDLKPENVVVGDYGEVVVLDWGLAITTARFDRRDSILADYKSGGGTPIYMPPELLDRDVSKVGTWSDIYLLGAMLFEVVSGIPPHWLKRLWKLPDSEVMEEIRVVIATNQIETDVPKSELMTIARKAMSTDPADRYATVEEFQDAVRQYRITGRAEEILQSIEDEQREDYADHQRALALFSEAAERFTDNRRAAEGARKTRLAYADLALRKADLDLAGQIIGEHKGREADLVRKKVRKAKRRRSRTKGVLYGFAAALAVATVASTLLYFNLRNKDERLKYADAELASKEELVQEKVAEALRLEEETKAKVAAAEKEAEEKVSAADRQAEAAIAKANAEAEKTIAAAAEQVRETKEAADSQIADARMKADAEVARINAAAEAAKSKAERELKNAEAVAKKAEQDADRVRKEAEQKTVAARRTAAAADIEAVVSRIDTALELQSYDDAIRIVDQVLSEGEDNPLDGNLIFESEDEGAVLKRRFERYRKLAVANRRTAFRPVGEDLRTAAISPDGTRVAAHHGRPGRLDVFNADGAVATVRDVPVSDAVGFSADGRRLVAAGQSVAVFDADSGSTIGTAEGGGTYRAVLSSPGLPGVVCLVRSDRAGTVEFWSLEGPARLSQSRLQHVARNPEHEIGDAVLTPDGKHFLCRIADQDNVCRAYPVTPGTPSLDLNSGRDFGKLEPRLLTLSRDGRYLAGVVKASDLPGGGDDSAMRVAVFPKDQSGGGFPYSTEPILTLKTKVPPEALAFAPDASRLTAVVQKRFARVWDLPSGELLQLRGMLFEEFLPIQDHGAPSAKWLAMPAADQVLAVSSATVRRLDFNVFEKLSDATAEFRRELDSVELSAAPAKRPGRRGIANALAGLKTFTVQADAPPASGDRVRINQPRKAYSVRFSPDGSQIIIGADDRAAHVYDSATGEKVVEERRSARNSLFFRPNNVYLEGHIPQLAAIKFLPPEGDLLLTQDYFGSVSVWDAREDATGVGYERFRLISEYSLAEFAVSGDGSKILVAGARGDDADEAVAVERIAAGKARLRHFGMVWSRDDLMSSPNPAESTILNGEHPRFAITALALNEDGSRAVTADRRGKVVLWDVAEGKVLARVSGAHANDQVSGAAFLPDGDLLTSGYDGKVIRWKAEGGRLVGSALSRASGKGGNEDLPDFIIRLRVTPDGKRFATSEVRTRRIPPAEQVDGVEAESTLVVTVWEGEGNTRQLYRKVLPDSDKGRAFRHDLNWSPDGSKILFVVDESERTSAKPGTGEGEVEGSRIAIFDVDSGEWTQGFSDGRVGSLRAAIAPGGSGVERIATFDGEVAHLWDLSERTHLAEFRAHAAVYGVDFSADRRYVVTGSDAVRVFNADRESEAHGQTVFRLGSSLAHGSPVQSVAFCPKEGEYCFASVDRGGVMKVWEWSPEDGGPPERATREAAPPPEDEATARVLPPRASAGDAAAWSPDGSVLASVQNGHLRLWLGEDDPIDVPSPEGWSALWNAVAFAREPVEGNWRLVAGGVGRGGDGREALGAVYDVSPAGDVTIAGVIEGGHDVDSPAAERSLKLTGITAVGMTGDTVYTGGADGSIRLWLTPFGLPSDGGAGAEPLRGVGEKRFGGRPVHAAAVTSIDVSRDGRVATAGEDGQVTLWQGE